jgi:phosphoenolpyruvate carboxylase
MRVSGARKMSTDASMLRRSTRGEDEETREVKTGKDKKISPPRRTKRADNDDQALIADIRLLGRILGDVIREQEGDTTYTLVEKIRTLSVSFRRDADHSADRALKSLLKGLSAAETVRVIRAFTYFSHLANLAEDRHQIRRRTEAERAGESAEGSLSMALARIRKAGV